MATNQAKLKKDLDLMPLEIKKFNRSLYLKVTFLALAALFCTLLYVFYEFPEYMGFIMRHRLEAVAAIILTGTSIGIASMIFQAMVNNRIITPSVLGLDSLFMLMQTTVIFFYGATKITAVNPYLMFFGSLSGMLLFSFLLFKFFFLRDNNSIFYVLLVGIVFGTFFGSATAFMQTLLDPGLFFSVIDVGFASFNNIHVRLLTIATIIVVLVLIFLWKYRRDLNVIALGRDDAINLGIEYHKVTYRLLFFVVVLTSVSTSLVGPITFLGLLVMNLSLQFMKTNRYEILIPACIFISITILVFGHFLVDKVFNLDSTLSIVINFVGGLYFLFILFKEQKTW